MRMTTLLLATLLSLVPAAMRAQPGNTVEVVFSPQGGRFFDAGDSQREIERTQAALSSHFQTLAQRWLAPGTKLRIEVTEIDLAGEVPPTSIQRVRVLKGAADWPRITLRYELVSADGKVERAEASVSDMNYTMKQSNVYAGEALAYEKRMLDDWFRSRFAQAPG